MKQEIKVFCQTGSRQPFSVYPGSVMLLPKKVKRTPNE